MTDDPRLKVLTESMPPAHMGEEYWIKWCRSILAELDAVDDLRQPPDKDAVEAAAHSINELANKKYNMWYVDRDVSFAFARVALAAALPALHARIAELERGAVVWRRPEEWVPLTDRNAVRKILVEDTNGTVWYMTMYAGVGTRTSWRRWADATPPPWAEPVATPATDANAPRVSAPGVAGVGRGYAWKDEYLPWNCPELRDWSIVGMNHYMQGGARHLFVAMTKDGVCIKSEDCDERYVWFYLRQKARSAFPETPNAE